MTDQITVTGTVGTDPRSTVTANGLTITNFRLASTRRYFDRATGQWTDGETNWYTVSTFRQLALNTSASLRTGERVVVHGRLRVRQWETADKSGLAIEIEADSIGHDLAWGTTTYEKTSGTRQAEGAASPSDGSGREASALEHGRAEDAWATPGDGWGAAGSDTSDESADPGRGEPIEVDSLGADRP